MKQRNIYELGNGSPEAQTRKLLLQKKVKLGWLIGKTED